LYTFSFLSLWFHGIITLQTILYLCKKVILVSYLIFSLHMIFTDLTQCFIITAVTGVPLILLCSKYHKAPHPHFCSAHAPAKFWDLSCLLFNYLFFFFVLIHLKTCTLFLFPITKPRVKRITRSVYRAGCLLQHLAKNIGIGNRVCNSDV
jgi:hypothetical protein